jgi:imidazolonepropionase-like amidohydrolase
LIKLKGWTADEMTIKNPMALLIQLPSTGRRRPGQKPSTSQKASRHIQDLKDLLKDVRFYLKRKDEAEKNSTVKLPDFNETFEALIPVIKGELPVIFSVHSDKDILDCIKFVKEENLKAVFYGATYGWAVADEIAKSGIPVILGSLYGMPIKWEDGYDAIFRNPGVLQKAGVEVAFSSSSAALAKDLPYHASKAVSFGFDKTEALKAVTINPAKIFGVDHLMGSLEAGKLANIVLADGDILEMKTNVKHVFIEGKDMDLSNRYTELLEKWKHRVKKK